MQDHKFKKVFHFLGRLIRARYNQARSIFVKKKAKSRTPTAPCPVMTSKRIQVLSSNLIYTRMLMLDK
jgi:hypothetical protein